MYFGDKDIAPKNMETSPENVDLSSSLPQQADSLPYSHFAFIAA